MLPGPVDLLMPLLPGHPEGGLPLSTATAAATAHWVRWFAERTGLSWMCLNVSRGAIVARSHPSHLPYCPEAVLKDREAIHSPRLFEIESGLAAIALPMPGTTGNGHLLCCVFLTQPQARPLDMILTAAGSGWSSEQLDRQLDAAPVVTPLIVQKLVASCLEQLRLGTREQNLEHEISALSQQLEYASDEIQLLHGVTEHLNVSRSVKEIAGISVDRIHRLIDAQAHVLILDEPGEPPLELSAGTLPFALTEFRRLIATLEAHDWSRPFVRNELAGGLFDQPFPGLESLVVVALGDQHHRYGWLISCNLDYGHYGAVESKLLMTVARLLATHVRNVELYAEHDEMLIGFVESLVSTLDAKDPYTRGHSERVALIARKLGEQLGIAGQELHDLYLSALLHDLGKIGVDDRILAKPEQLTEEEFRAIQRHPVIGYEILKHLRGLQRILPGVRSHHEAFNGRGYPDRLAGDAIPLMARILAVADSYDAMSSDRPYRRGMPVERVEEIFRRGAGEQWDRRIIDAYFAARDEIQQLCATYSAADSPCQAASAVVT